MMSGRVGSGGEPDAAEHDGCWERQGTGAVESSREDLVVGCWLEEAEVERDGARRRSQEVVDDLGVVTAWIATTVGAQLGDRSLVDGHDGDEGAWIAGGVAGGVGLWARRPGTNKEVLGRLVEVGQGAAAAAAALDWGDQVAGFQG